MDVFQVIVKTTACISDGLYGVTGCMRYELTGCVASDLVPPLASRRTIVQERAIRPKAFTLEIVCRYSIGKSKIGVVTRPVICA